MNKINFAAIWTAIVATAGVMLYAFNNFVSASDFQDLQWSVQRDQIRELEKEKAEGEDVEEDLEELLDRFCRTFPDDRKCKED